MNTYFFSYNVPADNHPTKRPDAYVDVVCKTDGKRYFNETLIVSVLPVITHAYDLMVVKDWGAAIEDMKRIATKYFEDAVLTVRLDPPADVQLQEHLS